MITIALLAGIMLASSCSLLRPGRGEARTGDLTIDRPVITQDKDLGGEEFSSHTLIVSYDTEVGTAPLDSAITAYRAEVIYRYRIINALAIRIPDGKDIHEAIRHFEKVEGVLAVNRDRIYHLHD